MYMYDYAYNITGVTHGHNNKKIQGYQGVYKCDQGCILLGLRIRLRPRGRKDIQPVFEGVGSVDETADNSASSTGNIPAGKYTYSEQTDETGRLTCDFVRQRNKEKGSDSLHADRPNISQFAANRHSVDTPKDQQSTSILHLVLSSLFCSNTLYRRSTWTLQLPPVHLLAMGASYGKEIPRGRSEQRL